MKIAVIGTGYVGLVTGTCFAEMGNTVWCVDINEQRIKELSAGRIPFFEPGLENMVKENHERGRLFFTTQLSAAIEQCELCFIAVGTPMREDGSADLSDVFVVADEIGRRMTRHICVVDKSTVPVGTAAKVRGRIQSEIDKRGADITFDVVSNPEFLKEGSAIDDCMKPDRIIIGADNEEAVALLKELYMPFVVNTENFIIMDIVSAEMTKYAANAMLATKISFMNEIANICELVGADVNKVRIGIGSDSRIGYQFIYPGCGYGGSCFPKDVNALIHSAVEHGYKPGLLQSVDDVNESQKKVIAKKVKARFGEDLTGLKIAIWGLSFKPGTDDMREAASITIIGDLTAAGADVVAYDPKAMRGAKEIYLKDNKNVSYAKSKYEAIEGVDAMVLVTEWKEFRSPDFHELRMRMKQPVIFDGRNQYDLKNMKKYGFEYDPIGVGNISGNNGG
jgi:UDPglucose 6-dehydrogenase